jgi:hypothetical protein
VDDRCAECDARYAAAEQQQNDAQVATEDAGPGCTAQPASTQTTEPTTGEPAAVGTQKKLSKLSVPELRVKYLEVVGRASGSVNMAYLQRKIPHAEKGKIPVGPRQEHRTTAEPQDHKVLPLRMEVELVTKLDEARERLGLKSRMDPFRRALHSYLANAGEQDVAALFAPKA